MEAPLAGWTNSLLALWRADGSAAALSVGPPSSPPSAPPLSCTSFDRSRSVVEEVRGEGEDITLVERLMEEGQGRGWRTGGRKVKWVMVKGKVRPPLRLLDLPNGSRNRTSGFDDDDIMTNARMSSYMGCWLTSVPSWLMMQVPCEK